MTNLPSISPSEMFTALDYAWGKKEATFFHGPSGVGKTWQIRAWAKHQAAKMGLDFYQVGVDEKPADWEKTFALIEYRVALQDVLDIKGAPTIEDGNTVFKVPSSLPDIKKHGKFGMFFLDELAQGAPSVTNGLSQIVYDRMMGENYRLPDDWLIVAAGNRKEDHANTSKVGAQMYNRFIHFEVTPDVKSWCDYQLNQGSDGRVPAFIRSVSNEDGSDHLHDYKKNDIAFSTPRMMSKVDKLITEDFVRGDLREKIVAAHIGVSLARKLCVFLELADQLATWSEIIKSPETARFPDQGSDQAISAYYVLMGMCAKRVDEATIDNAMTYIRRIHNVELQSVFVLDLQIKKPELMATLAISKWRTDNPEVAV